MIRFSIITYDLDSIESSKKYTAESFMKEFDVTAERTEPIRSEFFPSTLIGFVTYKVRDEDYGMDFNWDFDTNLANHRVFIRASQNYSGSAFDGPPTRITHSFFYMKAWVCPSTHPFFKMSTMLC